MASKVGRGKIECENGVYEGKLVDGKAQDDDATYTFRSGAKYTGAFADHAPNGKGTLKYASGNVYKGDWKDGECHGMGEWKGADGDVYVGEFQSDKYHGKGKFTWSDGDEYDGEWLNDTKHGVGTYTWKVGEEYTGEWKDDNEHGQGTFKDANGDTLKGEWVNAKRHGTFTKYEASSGHEHKLEYREGELLSSKRVVLLINGRGAKRSRTDDAVGAVVLDENDTTCAICKYEFAFDMNATDENAKRRLPILSCSNVCDHYFCHQCVLQQQMRIARDENQGRVPEWIRCMICREETAFCPSKPKYHRMLIDHLSRLVPVVEEELSE